MLRQDFKSVSQTSDSVVLYDRWLLLAVAGILAIGLLMVASASTVISDRQYGYPFHYLYRQLIHLGVGLAIALFVIRIPSKFYQNFGKLFLFSSLFSLILVLIPGIGREVNGSMRWLGVAGFGFQVSDLAKLFFILYLADYLERNHEQVMSHYSGFLKPMILVGLLGILLILEPDFGATVVIMATTLGMLFLAGVRVSQFTLLLGTAVVILGGVAISSPYRIQRLTTFLNPWAKQFDSGYQLTQSLIAFGRGGWYGIGLGESVQKLFYLPEAHTDFLFAVLAEELGLIGCLVIVSLFIILIARIMRIAYRASVLKRYFAASLAYGFALCFSLQAMINIGVNVGVLPTKGLTLPLMSYGGSSMTINFIIIALILRIDYENRQQK